MLDRVMVAGSDLTPLAERVLDHYCRVPPLDAEEFHVLTRSFFEELLRNTDAAELVASLVISLPAFTIENNTQRWYIETGYRWTLAHGLDRLDKVPVEDWRLSDQQIAAMLVSYQRMILADPHEGLKTRALLEKIIRRAASGGPALRAALISFIEFDVAGRATRRVAVSHLH